MDILQHQLDILTQEVHYFDPGSWLFCAISGLTCMWGYLSGECSRCPSRINMCRCNLLFMTTSITRKMYAACLLILSHLLYLMQQAPWQCQGHLTGLGFTGHSDRFWKGNWSSPVWLWSIFDPLQIWTLVRGRVGLSPRTCLSGVAALRCSFQGCYIWL